MRRSIFRVVASCVAILTSIAVIAQSAEDLVEKAIKLREEGKCEAAIDNCNKALSIDARHSGAYNVKGLCYDAQKQYDLAIQAYSEAIKIEPENKIFYYNRADTYRSKEDYDKAKADLKQVLSLDGSYSFAKHLLGVIEYNVKNYDQAIVEFNEAIKLGQAKKNCYWWIGDCYYYGKKDYSNAVSSYNEIINLDANDPDGYNLRGNSYYSMKEYEIAISDYKEALRIDPKHEDAHFGLGRVYYYQNKYDLAIKSFAEVSKLKPKNKNYHIWLGDAYYYSKEYDAALTIYGQVIRLNAKDTDGYRLRGRVYEAKKEYVNAIDEYNKIIVLDSSNPLSYSRRATVYRNQKLFELAIQDYTKAISIAKDPVSYYISRGNVYRLRGDTNLAIKDYNKAVSLDGKASTFSSRGHFYSSLKLYEKALEDFNEAIRIDAKYFSAYNGKANVFKKRKQYDLALNEYDKIIRQDPKYYSAYYSKANVYMIKGEYQSAMTQYETYKSFSTNSIYYVDVLPCLVRTGKWNLAREYAQKYLAENKSSYLDHDNWKFYKYYVAVIATDLPNEDYEKALLNLDLAIKDYTATISEDVDRNAEYVDILALKGYVLQKLSRFSEAKEIYEQALVIHDLQPDIKEALASLPKKTASIAANDKTIPEIQLISPQASRGLQVVGATNQTQVIGKAKDASGIASVTINGKTITKIEEDGLFTTTLSFKPGANNILITATDKKGNKATKTFLVTGNAVAKKQTEEDIIVPVATNGNTPQYHAIIIAAKDYTDSRIQDLENPVKDAAEFKSILETHYTFNADNIETLYNKSREEIMQSIIQKSNALGENDNLVIFYAGHGIAEKDRFGDVDGYWIPSSAIKGNTATYISTDDIRKSLKRSNSKHILVIADACFSGAFTRELSSDAEVGIQKQYNVPSRKIMASGNLEPVPDNSRFIYYLKKNLKDNKQKYLTAKKLFDGFYEAILNNSDTSPQYAAIKNVGDEGGEFVFIKK